MKVSFARVKDAPSGGSNRLGAGYGGGVVGVGDGPGVGLRLQVGMFRI